ncbi:MAG TPA: sulfatase-like hydrolase/transferase [Myxococcota bacterium]|nr:sulfatase-like hydrolase/transferase [Myxococcota bacterium]
MLLLGELLAVGMAALLARRLLREPWRGRAQNLLKAWLTVRIFWLLFAHEVKDTDGTLVATGTLIVRSLRNIDVATFAGFCAAAAGIKLVGILASMQRWILMLRGQGIALPFRHVFGSFLIGRFIGTFLPSTLGLDGYTLYDAARFSGRAVEATAAKFLEKIIGPIGIFLSFLFALPFGMNLLYEHTEIFPTRAAANTAALAGAAASFAIVAGLLALLWFPGVVQFVIERLPLPGKARLSGIVARVSHAAAAYRDHKLLLLQALALSFVVHFTTAAMYYFTALAIGAVGAQFWPVVLGSTVQILATVLSPITIAGEGIRELAQLLVLQHMIGPAAAVASAALGFWAAEALTLFGGIFWWIRGPQYRPSYCFVNGVQVEYGALAPPSEAAPSPYAARARSAAAYGFGAGVIAGLVLAFGEAFAIAQQGFGTEAQVLWYAPLAYAAFFGALCALGGLVLAAFPMDAAETRGWTPSLALLFTLVPFGLAFSVFRLYRDVYQEQLPPLAVLAPIALGFAGLALLLFFAGPRAFRGAAGKLFTPQLALALLILAAGGGFLAAGRVAQPAPAGAPPLAPPALAGRPNVILVMVDTLRADHLDCYGGKHAPTPNLCRIAADGGTLFSGFAHASWTKPSAATLLTSLVPSSHQAMAKAAALPDEIDTVAEAFRAHGYATGAYVSNTNLTEAFGFAQGFDEYHYLGPDYLFGAVESSSKLVLYQILRRVYFMLVPGLRFGDFYQDSEVVNRHAFEFLDRHADSRFFLFLHYMDPHDPYFEHPYNGAGIARAAGDPPAELARRMHELYVGEIAYLDASFGKLITKLEELGLYDESVIALVADHGEEFQEHGGYWHGLTLYDEQIHVPLMVKWRRGAPAAPPDARGEPARLIDVAPTLLAQAGASVPPAMQGIDLARIPAARAPGDQVVFAEENHEGNVLRAVRTKRWKWIEANAGNPRGLPERELFEVEVDPGETENVAEREAGTAAELARQASSFELAAKEHKVGEAKAASISKEECEQLKQLGYVQDCATQ